MTVRGFAKSVGVTPAFISDIEANRRRPGPEVLGKIAEVLGVQLTELEVLDPRLTPEVRNWMEERPAVGQLLRRLREAPDGDNLLRQMQEVVDEEERESGDEPK